MILNYVPGSDSYSLSDYVTRVFFERLMTFTTECTIWRCQAFLSSSNINFTRRDGKYRQW